MTCEPHRYLMSRVAGYDTSMPSVNFDVSSQYNTLAEPQYQGNDTMQSNRGGMFYAPTQEKEYRFAPQKQYNFGSVRSPSIGAMQPTSQGAKNTSADIADLPILKQADQSNQSKSFTYHGVTIGKDYSMIAAGVNHFRFETEKQNLARTVLTELEALDNRQTLLQVN